MANAPVYPETLKDSVWQKEKGLRAKMAGETGVGAALKKVEEAYKGVNWEKFYVNNSYPSNEVIEQAWLAAKAEGSTHFGAISKLLFTARDVANGAAEKYDQKEALKPAAVYARKIAVDAVHFTETLKAYGDIVLKEFNAAKEKLGNTQKLKAKIVLEMFGKTRHELEIAKAKNTFDANVWQKVRLVATQIAVSDWATDYKPQMKTLSSISPDQIKNPKMAKEHIEKIEHLIDQLEHIAPK